MRIGWRAETRVHRPLFYLRLKDGKIHVEEDWTKEGIANELMRAGVPASDIEDVAFADRGRRVIAYGDGGSREWVVPRLSRR